MWPRVGAGGGQRLEPPLRPATSYRLHAHTSAHHSGARPQRGFISLQANARAQRSAAADRPADTLHAWSDTRTTASDSSAGSEKRSASDDPKREKHRRLREQTTTPGEWLRIARAQTLARVGGSGSAHRPMRNATSKRNGSKHTKTSMPLRSSGAGTSAIEQRAEEGDHAQQSTEAMVSSPHMQQIRLTCSPDPSAACARMRVTTLSFGTCSRHLRVPVHTAKTVGPAR